MPNLLAKEVLCLVGAGEAVANHGAQEEFRQMAVSDVLPGEPRPNLTIYVQPRSGLRTTQHRGSGPMDHVCYVCSSLISMYWQRFVPL